MYIGGNGIKVSTVQLFLICSHQYGILQDTW